MENQAYLEYRKDDVAFAPIDYASQMSIASVTSAVCKLTETYTRRCGLSDLAARAAFMTYLKTRID